MKNRVAFLLCLDTAMLLLVVVLECINFTGLQWHQWLGFAFCPVVLLHVVLQWQWFITQFQRVLTPGAWRVRVNAGLNLLLLVMMGAVLFSGVFVSSQAVELVGEGFGSVRIWSDVHGLAKIVLLVLVGLHLGLNWDWIIGACARPLFAHGHRAAAGVSRTAALRDVAEPAATCSVSFASWFGRVVAILFLAWVGAGAMYFAVAATLPPVERAAMNQQRADAKAKGLAPNLAPRNRPISTRRAPDLAVTLALTVGVAVIGRYVFRLRL